MAFLQDARAFFHKLPKGLLVFFILIVVVATVCKTFYEVVNLAQAYFFLLTLPVEHPFLFGFLLKYSFHLLLAFGLLGLLSITVWAAFHPVETPVSASVGGPLIEDEQRVTTARKPEVSLRVEPIFDTDTQYLCVHNLGVAAIEVHGLLSSVAGLQGLPVGRVLATWEGTDKKKLVIEHGEFRKLIVAKREHSYNRGDRYRWAFPYYEAFDASPRSIESVWMPPRDDYRDGGQTAVVARVTLVVPETSPIIRNFTFQGEVTLLST